LHVAFQQKGPFPSHPPVREDSHAIRKKLPATLSRPDLEMAALDYFERLGHDNHRRLCRVYGWEEKKTKGSWGGSTLDYKTIARTAVREMNTREIQHFLVVCALASDLYCPRLQPSPVTSEGLELGAHGAVRSKPQKCPSQSERNSRNQERKGLSRRTSRQNAAEVENKPASAGGLCQMGRGPHFFGRLLLL
jgi:hypothetical protein